MERSCLARSRFSPRLSVALLLFASGAAAEASTGLEARLQDRLARIQIPFVANAEITKSEVAFSAAIFAGRAHVTRRGRIVYSLASSAKGAPAWTVRETPVASRSVRPVGKEPSETRVNYFVGDDPSRWRTGVETYRTVSLGQVWPGVSLSLRAYAKSVEKLFTVEPGADASRIRMRVDGGDSLRLDRDGSLRVSAGAREVRFTAPRAYQEHNGARRAVSVRYRVRRSEYGFALGDYDRRLPIVIDPLLQTAHVGGRDFEEALAFAIHPASGDVYVAGLTTSGDFPGTAGGAQPAYGGGGAEAFVARLDATLTTLIQASYLGGSGFDTAATLAIHPASGDVYMAGMSTSFDFPGTSGGAQPGPGGAGDVVVARLNAGLTALLQASYLGGSGDDSAAGWVSLAIDRTSGDVVVAGETDSTNFPGTAAGAQPSPGGLGDVFLARLNAGLTALLRASYLGGSGRDRSFGLAIRPASGEVYVTGSTNSTNFPGAAGGAQPTPGGAGDAFVARLNANLTELFQATYLGGSGSDQGWRLAFRPGSEEVYVSGRTDSTNFPGTLGGAQPASGGGQDVFAARLNASLTALLQASYLGGSGLERAGHLAIHPASGEVYLAGDTVSTNLPGTAGGAQAGSGGQMDIFVARLNAHLTTLIQTSYVGGSAADTFDGVAVHPTSGEVYVVGTSGAGRAADGFLARLTPDLASILVPDSCSPDATTLCLSRGRYRVRVDWDIPTESGAGQAITLPDPTGVGSSGLFWFFSPNNAEILVKVLDACVESFNRYWVFFAATTNVEFTLTVTDTRTGQIRSYFNPLNNPASPVQDTDAFATCP